MDMDMFQPDDIPLQQEGKRTLICLCPKCSANIELDLTQITEDANSKICPACKTRYVLTRESFARRASRKAGEINCTQCGVHLDHSQFCPSCKTLYPEYYAAELSDAAKKRARQNRDLFGGLKNISFEWHSSSAPTVDYKPVLMDSEPWQEPVHWKKKNIVRGVCAVVIIALVAVGIYFFSQAKVKKQYASTYVMALYGIKMGTDLELKVSNKISADWVSKNSTGQNVPPRITVDDLDQLNNIKVKADNYVQKLNNPPSAFTESNANLLKLNDLYLKLHTAVLNPSGSMSSFANLTQKADNDFKVAAADLKKNLPTELSAELEIAKAKSEE